MYQVSEALDAVISGSGRTFYAKLNGVQEGIQQIEQTAMSIPDDYMYIGGAISSKIDVSMYTKSANFKNGVEVKFEIGAYTGNEIEWIPMGFFTINESKKDRDLLTFVAYDRIGTLLNASYDCKVQTYPAESREFLKDISDQTGIEFDLSGVEDQFMIDKILSVDNDSGDKVYKAPFDGFTMQQVVGYIAQLYGKFAICDRNGKVIFRWYNKIKMQSGENHVLDNVRLPIKDQAGDFLYDQIIDYSDDGRIRTQLEEFLLDQDSFFIYDTLQYYVSAQTYIIKTNRYFDDLVKDESKCEIKGIGCRTETEYFTAGESDDLVIENQVMTKEWIDSIWAKIGNISFFPTSFSFMGDPRLDVGDVIVIIDASGNPVNVPVMKHTLKFDGGLLSKVSSHGVGEIEIKSPTSEALNRVKNDVLKLNELIAKKITADTADILYARIDKVNIEDGWISTAMIGDAQITDAKIDSLTASKITTGTLDAAKVTLINLDAGSITTGTITGLDALFNKSFRVDSPVSDNLNFVINASSSGFNVGLLNKSSNASRYEALIAFDTNNTMRVETDGSLRVTGKSHLSLVSNENIVMYPGYIDKVGDVYINDGTTNNIVLHAGNAKAASSFESGVEIGSIQLGNSQAALKVPLASSTQSGLITSVEKAKINTDYLPLAGGTLKSNNADVLGLNCTSGTTSTLKFYGNGTWLGSIGFNGQNSKAYRWNASGTAYKLLDEDDLKDSGWVNITISSGLSVVSWIGAKVRKIGKQVNLILGLTGVTKSFATIATIPEGYRPTSELNIAARYTDMIDAAVAVETSGNIIILNRTSGKAYDSKETVSLVATYFI